MEYIELTEEQRNSIAQTLAQEIVDRDLTAAAIFLLEAGRPFSFLGSQLMVFAEPLVHSVFKFRSYDDLAMFFENRANVELLIQTIEKLDVEARAKRAEEKRKWKAEVKAGKLSFWERLWGKRRYEKRPNQSLLDILNRLEEDKRREEKAASIPEGESGDQKPNSTQ
jgi:hypothetical protein